MNTYDFKDLFDALDTAKIYAEAKFERLCNNDPLIDACVFQSIRDSIAQNIRLLESYVICKLPESEQSTTEDIAKWTPVDEKLPKEGKLVIASTKCCVYYETRYTKENGWEWAYDFQADIWIPLSCVKAWMPQPKPYKVEDKEV